jgi:hypothetical protein
MNNYNVLKIKYIPSLFPSVDFTDTRYNYDFRIFFLKDFERVAIESEGKFKTVDSQIYRILPIQHQIYPKLLLKLVSKESVNLDYAKDAESVIIIDEYGVQYEVKIIEITYESINDTQTYYCNILCYAIDKGTVINYRTASWLQQRFTRLNYIRFENNKYIDTTINGAGGNIKFYSNIIPIKRREKISEPEKISLNDGRNIYTKVLDCEVINAIFYLTESELRQFEKYADRCFWINEITGNPAGTIFYDAFDDGFVTPSEPITYEVINNSALVDCYLVNVRIKYDFIDYRNFN